MRVLLTLFALAAAALPVPAAQSPKLWYTAPAKQWSEALPIGNGRLAAMVFGGIDAEHLQLNEETIYAGKRIDRVNPQARAAIPAIRQLLLQGKVIEAQERAAKDMLAVPPRQPPYEPFGDLTVSFDNMDPSQASNYRRTLDLYDGILSIAYDLKGTHYTREAFISYPDKVAVLHLKSSRARHLSFRVAMTREADATSVVDRGFGPQTVVLRGTALPPAVPNYEQEPKTGAVFTGAVRILSDGDAKAEGSNVLHVQGATEATLIFTAATGVGAPDPDAQCRQQLQQAVARAYPDILARHREDFRKLSTRVSLAIGDSAAESDRTPTDQLLARAKRGGDDTALAALYFAYGRYLLQSSSRENSLAANLQGKWNDKLNPSWGSKYTININTEMNYWPAETCNLAETVGGLENLLGMMFPSGERTAREMYGTAGFVAHHNTDGWGDTEPIDGVPSGIWPFGAAWLSLALWDRYDFSRDQTYLRNKAYPVLRSAVLYVVNNLFDDGAGHLVSGPSLSPENRYYTPDHKSASLDVSPTMDIEITTALFRRFIKGAEIIGVDRNLRARILAALPKLLPLQIGRYGQLQEWRKDYEEVDPGHRHLSHLFAVYPSDEINPSTPDLYRAARVSLERRLANGGGGTGWSRAWVVCLWATFHEGDKADESLRVLFDKSTWPNLFDLHPPGIFQIDGNFGATAGIAQMLLESGDGTVELLPALPASWKSGTVTGLCARGGLTADLAWQDGHLREATFHAASDGTFRVTSGKAAAKQELSLHAGETRALHFQ